jgi:hypothetical protein
MVNSAEYFQNSYTLTPRNWALDIKKEVKKFMGRLIVGFGTFGKYASAILGVYYIITLLRFLINRLIDFMLLRQGLGAVKAIFCTLIPCIGRYWLHSQAVGHRKDIRQQREEDKTLLETSTSAPPNQLAVTSVDRVNQGVYPPLRESVHPTSPLL